MVEGTPPGDALPPPPQRAMPARKGARCGAGAGSPRPDGPHPGHTGHGTPAARSRGRAAGGGTAPDTRRPSQWWKAPPPGTPLCHPHSEERRPARAHAVGLVLGPHARTDCTQDTRVAEPRPHAPEDGRPGEGQRLTPDAPRNGGRRAPPVTAPHHSRGRQPPQGMQAKGTQKRHRSSQTRQTRIVWAPPKRAKTTPSLPPPRSKARYRQTRLPLPYRSTATRCPGPSAPAPPYSSASRDIRNFFRPSSDFSSPPLDPFSPLPLPEPSPSPG